MADEGVKKKEEKPEEEKQPPDPGPSPSKTRKASKSNISRTSIKKGSLMSTVSEDSSSSIAMKRPSSFEKLTKVPKFQNTYRLDSKKPFKHHEVYQILERIVMEGVEEYPNYDPSTAMKLVQSIAADVRFSVRQLNYDRYKICVLVYLGEKKFQGFQAAFRALWDPERDAWCTFFYQTRTYFISCTCYGLYHD